MKWEYMGKQELPAPEGGMIGRGYTYEMHLWRKRVPNGWLLMALNSKSQTPDPVLSFYPDPNHSWIGFAQEDAESQTLLRPAAGSDSIDANRLLRAGEKPEDA